MIESESTSKSNEQDQAHKKQLHVYIEIDKNESQFKFIKNLIFRNKKNRPPSPILPLVKFDSQGDFYKEVLKQDEEEEKPARPPPAIIVFLKKHIDFQLVKNYCEVILKFLFSQIGLLALVFAYVVFGAFVFMKTESSYQKENQQKIDKNREDFYANLKHSAELMLNENLRKHFHIKYNQFRIEEINRKEDMVFHNALDKLNKEVLNGSFQEIDHSVINYQTKKINFNNYHKNSWNIELDKEIFYKAVQDHLSHLLSENNGLEDKADQSVQLTDDLWNFSNALLYTATVVTTIGYGNITPKSNLGKIFTLFYSMIGIPLMIMCLTNIGDLLAEIFISFYLKSSKFFIAQMCKLFKFCKREKEISNSEISKSAEKNETESDDSDEIRSVPLIASLGVLIAYVFGGAFIFAVTEGWSILDGVYFCFVTFTTIGIY